MRPATLPYAPPLPSPPTRPLFALFPLTPGPLPAQVRYYHRNQIQRDTGYYPDTPLSPNHAIMKGNPLRPPAEEPEALPKINYFSKKEFGTLNAVGFKKMVPPPETKPEALF